MSLIGVSSAVDSPNEDAYPLPFLGERWIPLDPRSPFLGPGAVLKGGFDGKRRYLGVRAEERDGVAGWVVRGDPEHPPKRPAKVEAT